MKVAVVGSRGLRVDIASYIPAEASEIITGGAQGIDKLAEAYAREHAIPLRVFLPDTKVLGRMAFLARNDQIVAAADMIIAIWDGKSRGTRYTIRQAEKLQKPVRVHILQA